MAKIRGLFITELRPYPPYGGQFMRCYQLLASLNHYFDIVVLAPNVAPTCLLAADVQAWHELPGYNQHTSLAHAQNFYYRLMPRPTWAQCIADLCQTYQPNFIWFDFGHWGQYVPLVRRSHVCTIMDTHNIQSQLTHQVSRAFPMFSNERVINWLRYLAQQQHERFLFCRFNRIVSVSETDRRYHARFVGDQRSVLIPNYIDEANYDCGQIARRDNLVVMTANFTAPQNRHGASWLLNRIWPLIRQAVPQAELRLVGRGADELFREGDAPPGVSCVAEVPTVAPHLREAALAVVPLKHGGGTRLKILEAWACEAPVVSTNLGAAGLQVQSGENIILADSARSLAQEAVYLLNNPHVGAVLAHNGLITLRRHYAAAVNTNRLKRLVEGVLTEIAV
ncbi:MAG: glycosyltransferase [Anaerolineae bacterium]|nr:glycosyltransferase [Anaerolineae bacterium]